MRWGESGSRKMKLAAQFFLPSHNYPGPNSTGFLTRCEAGDEPATGRCCGAPGAPGDGAPTIASSQWHKRGRNGQQPPAIMTWAAPLHGASSTHREAVGSHNAQPTTLSTRVAREMEYPAVGPVRRGTAVIHQTAALTRRGPSVPRCRTWPAPARRPSLRDRSSGHGQTGVTLGGAGCAGT